ncbi:hypothetical protein DW121_08750 [Bacteroides sp. AM10-21B]|nr:hypothetical protein DW121_08750 [Bacteroides sp. AM10-21B]
MIIMGFIDLFTDDSEHRYQKEEKRKEELALKKIRVEAEEQRRQTQVEAEERQRQFQIEVEQRRIDKQLAEEQKRQEKERYIQFSDSIANKVQQLMDIAIPDDRLSLVKILNQLEILLKANPYSDNSQVENKMRNSYTDAIIVKIEQILAAFASSYPDDDMLLHYNKILKHTKNFRIFKKYRSSFVLCLFLLVLLFFFLAITKPF